MLFADYFFDIVMMTINRLEFSRQFSSGIDFDQSKIMPCNEMDVYLNLQWVYTCKGSPLIMKLWKINSSWWYNLANLATANVSYINSDILLPRSSLYKKRKLLKIYSERNDFF